MALGPVFASRFTIPFTIVSGSGYFINNANGWPVCTIDYGNQGDDEDPFDVLPSRRFVNTPCVANAIGKYNVISLPISNEFVFVRDPDDDDDDDEDVVSINDEVKVRWIVKLRRF